MSLRTQVEKFAQHTSMHGFGRIILTKKPEKRLAWVIVFVAAWALFAYQLTSVLTSYLKYPKKTTMEFNAGGAPFPAITLCNMQSFDFYAIHKFQKDRAGLHPGFQRNDSFQKNHSFAYNFFLFDNVIGKYWRSNQQQQRPELLALLSRTLFAANLPDDVLDEISIKEKEFVVSCSYGNSSCKFTVFRDPYFFKCFTFEPPDIRNTSFNKYQSLSEGIANGFSAVLFTGIKPTENMTRYSIPGIGDKNPISGSAGIRVIIHPPGTDPVPSNEGYDVPPGFQASIGIVPERRRRLGKPYGLCAIRNRYIRNIGRHDFDVDEHEPYRKIACERMCMQQQVIDKCNCFDETLPKLGNIWCNDFGCRLASKDSDTSDFRFANVSACRSIPHIKDCALNDKCNVTATVGGTLENIRCANGVIERLMTDIESLLNCTCYAPCDEFRYDASYSLAKWPAAGYERWMVYYSFIDPDPTPENAGQKFPARFSTEKEALYKDYMEARGIEAMDDFAKINVYITDSNVLHISEEPAMTMTQLSSEIGGQLGIWIGVSVITISEVIETMLKIATTGCRKFCRKSQSKIKDPVDQTPTESNVD